MGESEDIAIVAMQNKTHIKKKKRNKNRAEHQLAERHFKCPSVGAIRVQYTEGVG